MLSFDSVEIDWSDVPEYGKILYKKVDTNRQFLVFQHKK